MRGLGILGSPRKSGNSSILAREILNGAGEGGACCDVVELNQLSFRGCQGCECCKVDGKCVQTDDMTPVYRSLEEADVIVIASPVYLWHVCGQMKLFLDRLYAWQRHDNSCVLPKGKKGVLVFSQGDNDAHRFRHLYESISSMLSLAIPIHDIIVATGGLEPGVVTKNKDLMHRARAMGRALASSYRSSSSIQDAAQIV